MGEYLSLIGEYGSAAIAGLFGAIVEYPKQAGIAVLLIAIMLAWRIPALRFGMIGMVVLAVILAGAKGCA